MTVARFSLKRAIFRHSIWLSILLHAAMVSSFLVVLHFSPVMVNQPKPAMYIPSYALSLPDQPTQAQKPVKPEPSPAPKPTEPVQKAIENAKAVTDKSVIPIKKEAEAVKAAPKTPPKKAASKNKAIDNSKVISDEQPVHLIGDKPSNDPLIKLLGKAISARLVYPRSAVDFNLKGTAYVGFTLHPNGEVTGIRIMQTSGAEVLDEAALRGIHAISPLGGANQYVPKKRFLVVGIIFR